MLLVLSNKGKGVQSSSEQLLVGRSITNNPNNSCKGDYLFDGLQKAVIAWFINNSFQKVLLKMLSCFILVWILLPFYPVPYHSTLVGHFTILACCVNNIFWFQFWFAHFWNCGRSNPLPSPPGKNLMFLPVMWFCQVQCKNKHSSTHNQVPSVSLERERETWSLSLPLQRDPGNDVVCAGVLIFALNLTKSHDWQEYKVFSLGGRGFDLPQFQKWANQNWNQNILFYLLHITG